MFVQRQRRQGRAIWDRKNSRKVHPSSRGATAWAMAAHTAHTQTHSKTGCGLRLDLKPISIHKRCCKNERECARIQREYAQNTRQIHRMCDWLKLNPAHGRWWVGSTSRSKHRMGRSSKQEAAWDSLLPSASFPTPDLITIGRAKTGGRVGLLLIALPQHERIIASSNDLDRHRARAARDNRDAMIDIVVMAAASQTAKAS
jgi:hypothetical protein